MNTADLHAALDSYLALRDALGFSTHAAKLLLRDFLKFVAARDSSGPLRAEVALEWACATSAQRGTAGQAARLSMARGFLAHLKASIPETEVPAHGLLASVRRPHPYLFTPEQLSQLLDAVALIGPRGSLRPHAYSTLIGLLASTGLRVGEALRLNVSDVGLDLDPPQLHIRLSKFRKSRIVPLHSTTAESMRRYHAERHRLGYNALSDVFFVSEKGQVLNYSALRRTFKRLTERLGLIPANGRRPPSLHSLRHTFAVDRLLTWYREGVDVRRMAPHLSVYLGHVRPQESYWYLSATPELLSAAGQLFQHYSVVGGDL